VNQFIQLADDSDEVPKLKGKSYADFWLSVQEWTELDLMCEVLQVCHFPLSFTCNYVYVLHTKEPADAQQSFLATCEPTVW
jgi:hypothetical protein